MEQRQNIQYEIEEVACVLLDLDYENISEEDLEDVEDNLYEKYEITFSILSSILDKLLKYVSLGRSFYDVSKIEIVLSHGVKDKNGQNIPGISQSFIKTGVFLNSDILKPEEECKAGED